MSALFIRHGSVRVTCGLMTAPAGTAGSKVPPPSGVHQRTIAVSAVTLRDMPARRPRDPLQRAPNAARHPLASGETLIVRPPPSMPNYRDSAELDMAYASEMDADRAVDPSSLPHIQKRRQQAMAEEHVILTEDQLEETKRLRSADPFRNTPSTLAKRFNCSPLLIRIAAPCPPTKRASDLERSEIQRTLWGPKKKLHRILRKERSQLW